MIRPFRGVLPKVAESSYVDPSAQVIGDVVIGERSSVWPNSTIRGDVNSIRIGAETNVQDNCVLHVETDLWPLFLGDRVTVGHAVVLHGCVIEDECLIGAGAVVLNGARIGQGSVVAAGALVTEGLQIPPNSLVMGLPAKIRRQVTDEERARFRRSAERYSRLRQIYKDETA